MDYKSLNRVNMEHQNTQPHSDRGIKIKEVMARTGVGKTKVYAMVKSGQLPKPRKFGKASRWSSSAVDAAIARIEAIDN